MNIRKTEKNDLPAVMALYAHARGFMAANGNPTQWGSSYPAEALLRQDIAEGCSYVAEDEDGLQAVFVFKPGPDLTYARIDGAWRSNEPYCVIHRVASYGGRGAASRVIDWCASQCAHLRIDTHRDNLPMQRVVTKNGFSYCGVIWVEDGSERLAYERLN